MHEFVKSTWVIFIVDFSFLLEPRLNVIQEITKFSQGPWAIFVCDLGKHKRDFKVHKSSGVDSVWAQLPVLPEVYGARVFELLLHHAKHDLRYCGLVPLRFS